MQFELEMPTKIIFGAGELDNAGSYIKDYASKVLVATGRSSTKKTGSLDRLKKSLDAAGVEYVVFDKIEPNPRATTIDQAAELARKEDCELIVALGGGSVMDASKGIATVAHSGRSVKDYIGGSRVSNWEELLPVEEAWPVITIPTLAATGSESNAGAVITNWETREKSGMGGPGLYPLLAIEDPELTHTVPADYTADGVVDMFTHLYEPYLTGDNEVPVMDEVAEGLMRIAVRYAKRAVGDPEDEEARAQLLWNSTLALNGLAQAGRDGSMPVHGIEHTVSAHYDISHGRGLAIIGPAHLEEVVLKDRPARLARLGRQVFGVSSTDDQQAARETVQAVRDWFAELGEPASLEEVGVEEDMLSRMAEETVQVSGRGEPLNSTRPLDAEDVEAIYRACYRA